MPIAEVAGVISAIITIIEASIKIYRTASDASGLPQSFRDAASRLPLVQDTLKLAADGLALDAEPSHTSLSALLEKCTNRAAELLDIFQAAITPPGASQTERYMGALKMIPQGEKVEALMEGIMADLQLLATNHAVKAATRKQMETLMGRIEGDCESCPQSPVILNNSGSGRQFVHSGVGHQNIVSGTATQINGSFSGGTFSFYQK